MKYIKMYEYIVGARGEYKFDDGNLKIYQIIEGPNKGKTQFRFLKDEDIMYYDSNSFMLGSSKILDTDYINNSDIRNIELTNSKHNNLTSPSKHGIIYQFFYNLGYNRDDQEQLRKIFSSAEHIYGEILENISLTSKNLGEVFDRLKKLRDVFFENEIDAFKRYKIEKDANKYNI